MSSEWSSLINKAYKTLQAPLERGEYLLGLQGVVLPEDNTISDAEFLMEMMERNEEVELISFQIKFVALKNHLQVEEAATKDELQKILTNLRDDFDQFSADFARHHESGKLEDARASLIKMKYLTSIEKSIKEKLLRV